MLVHFFYKESVLIGKLKELQTIDTKLKDLNDLLGDLPSKVQELDQNEEAIKSKLKNNQERLKETELAIQKLQLDITGINSKINTHKDQLFLVTNNKQYDALMSEIDHLKQKKDNAETESISHLEEKENLTSSIEKMTGELETLETDLSLRRKKLENAISESAEEKLSLEKNRKEQIEKIDPKYLNEYNRVLIARDGLAVVSISGNACGGCGAYLPPQLVSEIRAEIHLHRCDVCYRFLYSDKTSVN
tara:strand:+ start:2313 stop:3053 length:741 start_codon:yes stop_codon:yes gene_type:complete